MSAINIVAALRTPFGKFGGMLQHYSAVELGALAAKAVLERARIAYEGVGETIFGAAMLAAATSVAARASSWRCCASCAAPAAGTVRPPSAAVMAKPTP